ncbi:hypothetical protein NDU88_002835 [Pleurodeles waltl]|uniref:Uncharacterized protein n=1 Tax=Pleurodeles waltl TaxID=8319 RepID=A0AAV7RDX2_PLEWA|nr:hypothetical protein NDU88_002835 [Pleurodeles waltl]
MRVGKSANFMCLQYSALVLCEEDKPQDFVSRIECVSVTSFEPRWDRSVAEKGRTRIGSQNLRLMLSVQKPPPRPAQYEPLSVWDLMAIQQRQQKFMRRMKRAEKTLAEAKWDNKTKMWRRGIVDGIKMFPAITQEDETQGKKATCKTDKGSSKPKETQRSWVDEDDSDDEEFLNQLLHDRPQPYAINENAQSTSVGSEDPAQNKGIPSTVQTSDTVLIQNGVSVPTAPETQIQLQPPQIQRLYPDVPVLKTTTSLMVPADPVYMRSNDETELKQRKLKEKVMVMQIKAAQAAMQGNRIQQMVQQQRRELECFRRNQEVEVEEVL